MGQWHKFKNKDLERALTVIAMERVARSINDEDILMGWLMCGVADGDIDETTTPQEVIDMGYTEEGTFVDLMDCFLRCMKRAYKSGGLYCGDLTSTIGDYDE